MRRYPVQAGKRQRGADTTGTAGAAICTFIPGRLGARLACERRICRQSLAIGGSMITGVTMITDLMMIAMSMITRLMFAGSMLSI